MTRRVNELKEHIKTELYKFARRFEVEILVIENAVTIPLNLPLGLAITEFIAETGYPTIAHHHDFHWERQRFQVNCVGDYLAAAFPPTLPSIRHVVINSLQAQQIASRYGVTSRVIPNVMDFDSPPPAPDAYLVHQGEAAGRFAFRVAEALRSAGFAIHLHCGGGSFKSQMKKADGSGAQIALIVGDDETAANVVSVKLLRSGFDQPPAQVRVSFDDLAEHLGDILFPMEDDNGNL